MKYFNLTKTQLENINSFYNNYEKKIGSSIVLDRASLQNGDCIICIAEKMLKDKEAYIHIYWTKDNQR